MFFTHNDRVYYRHYTYVQFDTSGRANKCIASYIFIETWISLVHQEYVIAWLSMRSANKYSWAWRFDTNLIGAFGCGMGPSGGLRGRERPNCNWPPPPPQGAVCGPAGVGAARTAMGQHRCRGARGRSQKVPVKRLSSKEKTEMRETLKSTLDL